MFRYSLVIIIIVLSQDLLCMNKETSIKVNSQQNIKTFLTIIKRLSNKEELDSFFKEKYNQIKDRSSFDEHFKQLLTQEIGEIKNQKEKFETVTYPRYIQNGNRWLKMMGALIAVEIVTYLSFKEDMYCPPFIENCFEYRPSIFFTLLTGGLYAGYEALRSISTATAFKIYLDNELKILENVGSIHTQLIEKNKL